MPHRVDEARAPALSSLWPEAVKAVLLHAIRAVFAAFRRGCLYRLSFRGPISDRVFFQPDDPRPRRLDDADGYFRNRFRFAGHTVDAGDGCIFDCPLPSSAFATALHGFEWLRHLEAAGGDNARTLTLKLAADWLSRYARYAKPAWEPHVIAARFLNLFAHGRFFLVNSDLLWRSKLFVSLRNQTRVLSRTIGEAPDGLPRLEAAAALTLAGLCLADERATDQGLKRLAVEIERQILPDGGHVGRSPEALTNAYWILSMVQQALDAANRETQSALRSALDRMAPMVRFFRFGDGTLGVFNGGGESDSRLIAALLARDEAQGRPFGHAPHSAYQRLAAGRTLVLLDIGRPPPGAFSTEAHAGCLAFEMSAGAHRLVVNCGIAASQLDAWQSALRATAAHSTLTIADTSSAMLLTEGWLRDALGPRLVAGTGTVETRRSETSQGLVVENSHDFYVPRFGLVHRRRVALSPKGLTVTGTDQLIPVNAKGMKRTAQPFAIRFHIHPDVRLSLAQGGGSVLLKLPNGEGWRFRCGGGALSLEESVYLGGGSLRRTEQLVLSAQVKDEDVECAWLLEQVGAA